jgi:uncharacterized OB-fold protein
VLRGPEPSGSDLTEPFWNATRAKQLVIQWCIDCNTAIHFPRDVCPRCLGTALEYRPSTGAGEVHARIVVHHPEEYVVALIELREGVRLMSNVVNCAASDVKVGLPVEVTWEPLSDGRNLPQFQPEGLGSDSEKRG